MGELSHSAVGRLDKSALPAATRSRKLVVLVGTLKALAIAVKNMDARRRVTLLKQRLQACHGGPATIQ